MKKIEYCKEIIFLKELINSVLRDINVLTIDSNNDFNINKDWHHNCYVKYVLKKEKCIDIELDLFSGGLTIQIDEIEEAYDYSYDFILENILFIKETIKIILTNSPHLTYCFHNYSQVKFLDENNNVLRKVSLSRSIFSFLKLSCKEKVFHSFYEIKADNYNLP